MEIDNLNIRVTPNLDECEYIYRWCVENHLVGGRFNDINSQAQFKFGGNNYITTSVIHHAEGKTTFAVMANLNGVELCERFLIMLRECKYG